MRERKRTVWRILLVGTFLATLGSASSIARADPRTKAQCIEANTNGQDLRRDGKLAAAREQFRSCVDSACPSIVRDDCNRRLDELERAQPTIVFETKDGAGNDVTAVKVSIDGQPVADSLNGAALLVDPGAHTFTFEVVGQPPVTKPLLVHEGEKGRTERVLVGANAPSAPSPAAPSAAHQPAPGEPLNPALEPTPSPSAIGSTQRTIGLVAGGVGAAALVAGGIFGGLAIAGHSDYEKNCGSNIGAPANQCNQTGLYGHDDAATKGVLSTAFLIGGGVAAVAGAVLFLTAPHGTAQVEIGPAGAFVVGRF